MFEENDIKGEKSKSPKNRNRFVLKLPSFNSTFEWIYPMLRLIPEKGLTVNLFW